MKAHLASMAIIIIAMLVITSSSFVICSISAKRGNFRKWVKEHKFNVHYKAHYKYSKDSDTLTVKVKFKVIDGLKEELIGLEFIKEIFKINVTSYGSLSKAIKRLPRKLQLDSDEIDHLVTNGTLIKSLGDGSELITSEPEPWWLWDPPLPRYVWQRLNTTKVDSQEINYYVAADPINIIFRWPSQAYTPKDFLNLIIEELRDKQQVPNDGGTDDDWPDPTFAYDMYISDYLTMDWKVQDAQVVEGDDEGWSGRDEWNRIHIRLWITYSPAYGYIVASNVHLEQGGAVHEIIHIDNDYSPGYEDAEIVFIYEFESEYNNTAHWWFWESELCVWFHSDTYDSSLGDCITS